MRGERETEDEVGCSFLNLHSVNDLCIPAIPARIPTAIPGRFECENDLAYNMTKQNQQITRRQARGTELGVVDPPTTLSST